MVKIILKKGREESLRRFHPWVFSGAIAQIAGNPAEGDIVGVYASDGTFMAAGHYQIGSIAVRILSFDSDIQSPDFWEIMIRRALDVRIASGLAFDPSSEMPAGVRTDCYRLVHGEGDNLPGLIIDFYDGICVLYDKSSGTAPFKAGLDLVDGYLYRKDGFNSTETAVLENGHRFIVNWESGQKTGFFLDQRENRALVERYSGGRSVLNLFCYTGGFSIYALAGGALHVDSVDSSKKAMDLVEKNVRLNGFEESRHTGYCCDALDYLKEVPEGKYDLMIVDPPAFAKHRGALKNALRAYQRLNAAAISKVASRGLIFTYSCSQVVDKEAFALAVFSAAAQTGRSVRILDRLNQPADHSVNIYHPEGEYLKGLLLYVE